MKEKYTNSITFNGYPSEAQYQAVKLHLFNELNDKIIEDNVDIDNYDFHNIFVTETAWGFKVSMEAKIITE